MIGRRVASIDQIERPGDYFGPIRGYASSAEVCFFLLPNAGHKRAAPGQRSIHHVAFPPHTYRECPDGSLEIRASIGAAPFWHGFLDEGHVWRKA